MPRRLRLPTVMTANLAGADLATIAHTVKAVQSKVLVRPEIKRPEDIKGKRLASSGLGSLGDFLLRVVIRKYGMNPERDVTWLPSARRPIGCRHSMRSSWMQRTFPIPSMFKPRRKGYRVFGMRA